MYTIQQRVDPERPEECSSLMRAKGQHHIIIAHKRLQITNEVFLKVKKWL